MFTHKEKCSETRLDSGPAATPQGVDLQLVNGSDASLADMDPDSSVLCDSQVSSNTNINTNDKTILLEEIQDSGTNKCIESSVSFVEVSNISQNFTLNVGPSVSNLAAIQNVVPGGNPTLWLPTIITSSTTSGGDDATLDTQMEDAPGNISQIILSGNGGHPNQLLSTPSGQQWQPGGNNNKYTPKVQILTIPKQSSVPPPAAVAAKKTLVHTTYLNPSDVNKCSASPATNSILGNQMPTKSCSSGSVPGQLQAAPGEMHMVNMPSSTSSSSISVPGRFNNTTGVPHQSHVLSKVVPGPKLSSQSLGRGMKSNSVSQARVKTSGRNSNYHNVLQSHATQSPMSVKIIQQQNIPVNNKSGLKSVPSSRAGVLSSKQRASTSSSGYQANSHKQGTYTKSVSGGSAGKPVNRNVPQRLVVQQTPSRLMMSTNVNSYNKGLIQYYQPSPLDNCDSGSARYNSHQSYSCVDTNVTPNSTSNQSLTAQILQTLSQPKILPSRALPAHASVSPARPDTWDDSDYYSQYKCIHGDPTTLRSADDTLGIEERPNLPDESLSYHYYNLQLVMLDHTYAVTPQSIAVTSSANLNTPPPVTTNTSIGNASHANNAVPSGSPVKALPSPIKIQSPLLPLNPPGNSLVAESNFNYSNMTSRVLDDGDDDAGSVLSSVDGDERRAGERNGSDTETAPEGEGEEEGKTRCVCEFTHDDGYMICCDRCGEWQHVDCMGIDRQNIPDDYMCDRCQPRLIDRKRARSIQMRKKEELTNLYSSASDSSSGTAGLHKKAVGGRGIGPQKKQQLLTVTTYSNTISGVSRTVPMLGAQHQPPAYSPFSSTPNITSAVNNKRGPKRARRVDSARKGPKRKIPEKKVRRKSDMTKYKSKYGTNSSQQVNQWSDSYELAMTNHYSPELRAKIARYSSNKVGSNHSVMSSVLTAHFCTTVPHAGSKILIATKDMKENCPIIELRGKYMLSTQHKPQPQPGARAGSQRPGPYLFFYKFPKDPTQVCIDTRTYGNEARFVRRSCKPNAELQHCIIKGALHVYLLTVSPIQSNTEITIRHDSPSSHQPCACGNPKHCRQATHPLTSEIVHKNNGASSDLPVRERRGRTRHTSSSNNLSALPNITSPNRKEPSSPKVDKRRKSEPEFNTLNIKSESSEVKPDIKLEPSLESDLEVIKASTTVKEEPKTEDKPLPKCDAVKEESDKGEATPNPLSQDDLKVDSTEVKVKTEKSEETGASEASKGAVQSGTSTPSPAGDNTSHKNKEAKGNKSAMVRRTSTHSMRTTRASVSTSNAAESADEKSDSQTDCKMSAKEKKKMTREERKMEAIVKAIERMEKAEQRKLENKDKQIKRRESDPQQSCSVTSSSESNKDPSSQHDTAAAEEAQHKANTKGRPRRRGRSRTASQTSQTKNANRMNSVDSDNMGTSEDEHHPSLMSPPRKCQSGDSYLDTPPSFQSLAQTDAALKKSFDRMNYDLSSVCLLVEAAVGPLETTFKSPKTKKVIMNEWLNKSPEANISYDMGSPEYSATDNNNTSDSFGPKSTYTVGKCTENLVKAASTMIGNLSGGVITADSTPEKESDSDASPPNHSPLSYPSRSLKRFARELTRDTLDKTKTPKKMRRVLRSLDSSPMKRTLRSSGNNRDAADQEGNKTILIEKQVNQSEMEVSSPVNACLPPPPQHSAKKRWLRQAISEESDSPTAESPPSEMLTPLKKRRLARESLTSEAVVPTQSEDSKVVPPIQSPSKDVNPLNTDADAAEGSLSSLLDSSNVVNIQPETLVPSCGEPAAEFDAGGEERSDKHCDNSNDCQQEPLIRGDVGGIDVQSDAASVVSDVSSGGGGGGEEKPQPPVDNNNVGKSVLSEQNKSEPSSALHSTETSCNSSPVLDEMDDIQKKIHSFHTENIQILKIRNKKQPKEKRKKVNLNFDLSVLDDQTVEVKLKCDKESAVLSDPTREEISSTSDIVSAKGAEEASPLVTKDDSNSTPNVDSLRSEDDGNSTSKGSWPQADTADVASVTVNNNFTPTLLFSETFRNNMKSSLVEPITTSTVVPIETSPAVPEADMSLIKNVIDMTVSLENSVFKDAALNAVDEYKNVEEILSRVNQMDSSNSVLLSGLMRDAPFVEDVAPPKVLLTPRSNDPRLHPPPTDKPKPIRRKLSITEYRRRHSMVHPSESSSSPPPSMEASSQPVLSEDEEDISQFEKKLEASLTKLDNIMSNMNMGVCNAQATVPECQHREKLSERLRREFGLSIPEEEVSCSAPITGKLNDNGSSEEEKRDERISEGGSVGGVPLPVEALAPQVRLDG